MKINDVIQMIPEISADEAFESIETIRTNPANNTAAVRCHLSREFRLRIAVVGDSITISSEGRPDIAIDRYGFLPALRREIHEVDNRIASGQHAQTPPKPNYIEEDVRPPAPEHFDIPMWDPKTQSWYDAEW